ncbi:hypothetical protein Tco_0871008 [Tanacetum coccineum]
MKPWSTPLSNHHLNTNHLHLDKNLTIHKPRLLLILMRQKQGTCCQERRRGSLDSEDEAAENSSKQGRNLQKDESEVFETPKQGKSSGETDISPQGLEAAETLAEALNVIMVFEDVVLDFQQYIKSTSEKSSYGREHVSANQREGKEIGKNKAEEELKMRRREELKRHDELATKKIARGHGKVYGYGYKERSRKRTGCRASKKIFQKLKLTREDVSIPNEMDKSQ